MVIAEALDAEAGVVYSRFLWCFYCCDCHLRCFVHQSSVVFAFCAHVLIVCICCVCWSSCLHSCRCRACCCCCSNSTIFHPCWSSQLAAHSVLLCQQIGLRWMPTGLLLERKKERETPANTSPPLNISLSPFFYHLPPSIQSFCCCDLWRQAVIGK